MKCDDCQRELPDSDYFTEINPEGGYGRPRFLACDDCMKSGRWSDWKAQHWPNWPSPRELSKTE